MFKNWENGEKALVFSALFPKLKQWFVFHRIQYFIKYSAIVTETLTLCEISTFILHPQWYVIIGHVKCHIIISEGRICRDRLREKTANLKDPFSFLHMTKAMTKVEVLLAPEVTHTLQTFWNKNDLGMWPFLLPFFSLKNKTCPNVSCSKSLWFMFLRKERSIEIRLKDYYK